MYIMQKYLQIFTCKTYCNMLPLGYLIGLSKGILFMAAKEINCEFALCIYNENGKCSTDEITILSGGVCGNCILPDFPDGIIKKYKQRLLGKLDDTDAAWNDLLKKLNRSIENSENKYIK